MNLEQIELRMNQIVDEIASATDVKKITDLTGEYEALLNQRSALIKAKQIVVPVEVTKRGNNPMVPVGTNTPNQRDKGDLLSSKEYRTAFMNYVKTGKYDAILSEARADATSNTSDIVAVIPTTIVDTIIEELKDYGDIYALVTKTNLPGGVTYPTASVKPTATWVSEGSVAEKQKKEVKGKITFTYHKLQIRVAVTLEASVVSLDVFDKVVASNLSEAIVVALEEAIVNGSGLSQPLGITKDESVPAGQIVEFLSTDATWKGWKTLLFGKMPTAYRKKKTAVILTNQATYDAYIDGMVDDNNQPIARVTASIDGAEIYRFNGRKVIPTDTLPSFDDADAGDIFAVYVDLKDYVINSNMQVTYKKYYDEATDEWIQKVTVICDGKLIDPHGVVLLKKKVVVG